MTVIDGSGDRPDKAMEGRSMWWFRTQTEEADS